MNSCKKLHRKERLAGGTCKYPCMEACQPNDTYLRDKRKGEKSLHLVRTCIIIFPRNYNCASQVSVLQNSLLKRRIKSQNALMHNVRQDEEQRPQNLPLFVPLISIYPACSRCVFTVNTQKTRFHVLIKERKACLLKTHSGWRPKLSRLASLLSFSWSDRPWPL